ncbi:MAG: transcriptional repressor LexA [Fimbriimonadaceae bacterium]
MAKGLTQRQQMILQYLFEYAQINGYPPSIREIGMHFEIGSLRGVTVHLDALEKKGYIERNNTPRSIKVTHPDYQSVGQTLMLPLLGSIAAGVPIHAQEHIEDMIPIPTGMVKSAENAYCLRVRGDSMTGEGINPRDIVVIKQQKTANHGDLVAVLIDGDATVKRIHFDRDAVRLIPANPNYDPIVIESENAFVLGRVVGLIRDYDNLAY